MNFRWPGTVAILSLTILASACAPDSEPTAISLLDHLDGARIEGAVDVGVPKEPHEWIFTGDQDGSSTFGWEALDGVDGLSVVEDRLVGRTTSTSLLLAPGIDSPDPTDFLYSLTIEMKVSAGTRLSVAFESDEEMDRDELAEELAAYNYLDLDVDIEPSDELQTHTLTPSSTFPISAIRHIFVRPTDAKDAEFEIASMRLKTLKEHLASIPSGIGWHSMNDVFRETLVSKAPEQITFEVDLPSAAFLDLALGTLDSHPVTFQVDVSSGGSTPISLLRRTLSTPQRWSPVQIDLQRFAGSRVALTLSAQADENGTPAFWGTPVIRNPVGDQTVIEPTPARLALSSAAEPPRGVIVILADTLRRDHLAPWGYERASTPILSSMASEGAVFLDAISQGTWTKVSVPSILSSLYPTTHGVVDMPDRLPAAVTTLAEVYRQAGYTTFATSSIPFSGKQTNLHQGIEILYESTSFADLSPNESKTARSHTDQLIDWLEGHHEVPFFAFLHIFDPHTPFEPYPPYDSLYLESDLLLEHRDNIEKVSEFIDDDFRRYHAIPVMDQLEAAGIDPQTFLDGERAWYDASIRAMDVEIGRLLESLEQFGLVEETLIAFVSDHGEEFLEHGERFHGYSTYGEMLNVPLMLHWPGVIPQGRKIEELVQTIDLMPTLLELSRLPVPDPAQGQSLLPLLLDEPPAEVGWRPRPAFAERIYAPQAFESDDKRKLDSWTVIDGGWKLIRNGSRPEGWPEFELYNHRNDPLNLTNVAEEHPEKVERLNTLIDKWQSAALEARFEADSASDMSPEEINKLRSLGYIQ
jgi:arylsulfatase A-like enzyme